MKGIATTLTVILLLACSVYSQEGLVEKLRQDYPQPRYVPLYRGFQQPEALLPDMRVEVAALPLGPTDLIPVLTRLSATTKTRRAKSQHSKPRRRRKPKWIPST
jgi:hypothetical protein